MLIKSFKLFEYSKQELFVELTENEYTSWYRNGSDDRESINSDELKIISDIFDNHNLNYILDSNNFMFLVTIANGGRRRLFALKDEDEYYYVVTNIDGVAWYKCDTINGFKQCIEHLASLISPMFYFQPIKEIKESANSSLYRKVYDKGVNVGDYDFDKKMHSLNNEDTNMIYNLFSGTKIKKQIGRDIYNFTTKTEYSDNNAHRIVINKDNDEYYYVTHISMSIFDIYECDTLEGLKQCLTDVFIDKYIKESIEYKSIELYHEISESEYQNFIDDYSTGDFNACGLVESIFESNNIEYRRNNICTYDLFNDIENAEDNEDRQTQIIIDENSDEYYCVDVYDFTLSDKERFYKYDSKEGLKQCIEYIIGKTKINEAKFNKRGKTTQDHKRDIEDVLLEYVDDDLFSVVVRPIIPYTASSKRIKDLSESTRSFEVVLGCNREQIIKHKLYKIDLVYNYDEGRYDRAEVGVTKLINAHLEKYYDLVKARLEKYNYFVFDSKHRPTHFSVIYRRNKYKSS
jgi:hypothetical protein